MKQLYYGTTRRYNLAVAKSAGSRTGNNNVDARCDSWLETMKDIEERINKLDE